MDKRRENTGEGMVKPSSTIQPTNEYSTVPAGYSHNYIYTNITTKIYVRVSVTVSGLDIFSGYPCEDES